MIKCSAIAGLLLAFGMVGCGDSSSQSSEPKNIFGGDNRQPITSAEAPWSAIGKLSTGCTATIVDSRLILTAAHCVFTPTGEFLSEDFVFSPNLKDGHSDLQVHTERVWYGTKFPYSDAASRAQDWAVFLLDREIASTYGSLSVKEYAPAAGDIITLAGYSADYNNGNTATVHQDCHVRGWKDGQFLHDCDMTRGASGGPIWANFTGDNEIRIIGVQSGEYRDGGADSIAVGDYEDSHANNAIPSSTFFETLNELVNTY